MKKPLTMDGLNKLHVEEFGALPVITGASMFKSKTISELIVDSIVEGKPYIEQEIPENMDV